MIDFISIFMSFSFLTIGLVLFFYGLILLEKIVKKYKKKGEDNGYG